MVFYILCNGVDSFFQSQTYAFAVYGPLKLSLMEAARVNQAYFGFYCLGRLISIGVSPYVSPTKVLVASMLVCPVCSGFLAWGGASNQDSLVAGTAMMGFWVSFQFASGLSWLATNLESGLKSLHTSLVFVGANVGLFVLPPLAAYLFTHIGHEIPFILAFALNLSQILVFVLMNLSVSSKFVPFATV